MEMENLDSFVDYICQEVEPEGCTSIGKVFNHSQVISKDGLVKNNIGVKLNFFNIDAELISSHTLKFTNGSLSQKVRSEFKRINGKELENKFAASRATIIDIMEKDLTNKVTELERKRELIAEYGRTNPMVSELTETDTVKPPIGGGKKKPLISPVVSQIKFDM